MSSAASCAIATSDLASAAAVSAAADSATSSPVSSRQHACHSARIRSVSDAAIVFAACLFGCAQPTAKPADGTEAFALACAHCHASGLAGVPAAGVPDDWNTRDTKDFEVLLERRNDVVLEDLELLLIGEPDVGRIAVFYGAAHMADLEARLTKELGLEAVVTSWLAGVDLRFLARKCVVGHRQSIITIRRAWGYQPLPQASKS